MKIAIDISSLQTGHRVRGVGFYLENLKSSLLKYDAKNEYIFFKQGESLPRDIDLVHYPYFDPFFLTLPLFKKYKIIVTVHDLIPIIFPAYFPSGIKGMIKWQIQKRALKRVNSIITDSESSRKDIAKYTGIPLKKINVVYLAAGEEFKQVQSSEVRVQSLRKKYNLPEKFVLYVGDVTWNKNLPRLVEAIKKINLTLVLVGKAVLEDSFDKLNPWNKNLVTVQNSVKDDQRFIRLGFIPTDDLVGLYNLTSVFVMPSLYEGFGLPILEAMKCGCPVVTTREGSIPEIAGEAAFYVDAYDVSDIANGVGEVFYNKKIQAQLSKKGLMQSNNFSWEKTVENTVAVYKSLIS